MISEIRDMSTDHVDTGGGIVGDPTHPSASFTSEHITRLIENQPHDQQVQNLLNFEQKLRNELLTVQKLQQDLNPHDPSTITPQNLKRPPDSGEQDGWKRLKKTAKSSTVSEEKTPNTSQMHNKFNPLNKLTALDESNETTHDTEDMETTQESTQPKAQRIPPIYLTNKTNWPEIATKLSELLTAEYEARDTKENLKILLQNPDDYRATVEFLNANNIPFHTFSLEKPNTVKITLKGLPPTITKEEIQDELIRVHGNAFNFIRTGQIKSKKG